MDAKARPPGRLLANTRPARALVKAPSACHGTAMSTGVSIGDAEGARLVAHPLRAIVLGEVHARPFTPLATPRRILHFAFETTAERGEADRSALIKFCAGKGLVAPRRTDKHHRLTFGGTTLRWEQHSEFTTY